MLESLSANAVAISAILDIVFSIIIALCGAAMVYMYANPESPRFREHRWIVYMFKGSVTTCVTLLITNVGRLVNMLVHGGMIYEPIQVAINASFSWVFITVLVFHVMTVER